MTVKEAIPSDELALSAPEPEAQRPELLDQEISELIQSPIALPESIVPKISLVGLDQREFARWSLKAKRSDDGSITVNWEPNADLAVPVKLAEFRAVKGGVQVDWKPLPLEVSVEVRTAQEVIRDCILEVEARTGRPLRILLRRVLHAPAIAVSGKETKVRWSDSDRPQRPFFMEQPVLKVGEAAYRGELQGEPELQDNQLFSFDLGDWDIKLALTFHRSDSRTRRGSDSESSVSSVSLEFAPNEKQIGSALESIERQLGKVRSELRTYRANLAELRTEPAKNKDDIKTITSAVSNIEGRRIELEAKKNRLARQKAGVEHVTQSGQISATIAIEVAGENVPVAIFGPPE